MYTARLSKIVIGSCAEFLIALIARPANAATRQATRPPLIADAVCGRVFDAQSKARRQSMALPEIDLEKVKGG